MKRLVFSFLVISGIWVNSLIYGEDLNINRNQFFIGPQWYHVLRTKDGGAKQQGGLIGACIGFERLKRCGWYVGAEASYACGTLKGKTAKGKPLRSHYSESFVEGRLGFTVQQESKPQVGFTPFAGFGYFIEQNNFINPSPLSAHFKTRFTYVTAGILSQIHFWERLEVGANFQMKYPFAPKCRVSNDEDNDPNTQRIGERFFYRVELPVTYTLACMKSGAISAVPFYESRVYGRRPNFPFNFIKTKFESLGVIFKFLYRF